MNFDLLLLVVLLAFGAVIVAVVYQNVMRMRGLLASRTIWKSLGEKFNLAYDASLSEAREQLTGAHRACPLSITGQGDPLSDDYQIEVEVTLDPSLHPALVLVSEPPPGSGPFIESARVEGPAQAPELLSQADLRTAWDEAAARCQQLGVRDQRLRLLRTGPLSDEAELEALTELAVNLAITLEEVSKPFTSLLATGYPRALDAPEVQIGQMPIHGALRANAASPMRGDFFEKKAGFPVVGEWDRSGERRAVRDVPAPDERSPLATVTERSEQGEDGDLS
ncbi:hypothetical protein DL240_13480 [Lujinxingia litoralis]|uniref:Uncharacterized protein n=1 Tax=Lujinxingia litoralis TaxID=2211119 RepID=A0A328C4W3_9DELT|nr:hypothetical protein [Lujinxingia litoralis]RAL21140.1 hypothetical protein DL240_13480 [Lujinxingia litoralis]